MMTKLIILNAPPKSGKDSSAKYVEKKFPSGMINLVSFKKPLFDMVLSFFSIDRDEFFRCYNDSKLKEVPHKDLKITDKAYVHLCRVNGVSTLSYGGGYHSSDMVSISPRNAMIYISECVAKPTFGDDVFGQHLLPQLKQGVVNLCVDGGFKLEMTPSIELLGKDNVSIVQIHRPNYDFTGDSRKYLPNNLTTHNRVVWNTGTEDDFNESVLKAVQELSNI